MPQFLISPSDELKLRELAVEIAKDIEDAEDIVKRLGFTWGEYNELCETRMFRNMLTEAVQEWKAVNNTPRRVKLKAAVNLENGLPDMFQAMTDQSQPLASRVKVFEIMARIGGLGNPEPIGDGMGASFQLTIHLAQGKPPIIIENVSRETGDSSESFTSKLGAIPSVAQDGDASD